MTMDSPEEHRMIREELGRFLARLGGVEAAMRQSEGQAEGEALWQALAGELMFTGIGLPEAQGGLGADMRALSIALRELGRVLCPVPFLSTVGLVGQTLAAAPEGGVRDAALARIAGEGARAAMALAAPLGADPVPGVTAQADGDGFVLTGAVAAVADLAQADLVLVPARLGDDVALFLLSSGDLAGAVTDRSPADATRPVGRLSLDGLSVAGAARVGDGAALAAGLARARLCAAAEMAGAARGAFDITRAYIAERKQFGRRIDSYQAIKHRVADLFVALNAVDALIDAAAAAWDEGDAMAAPDSLAALAAALEVLERAASESIQLHGGVGMTWEYSPHLFHKRALAMRADCGAPEAQVTALGRALLAGDLPVLPDAPEGDPLRREVANWMQNALTGRFAELRHRGGAGDGDALTDLRKDWEAELAKGGWVGLDLPKDLGGRALTIAEQVAFHEEYARAGGPGRMGHIGEGLMAPTLAAFGTDAQKARHLPGILDGTVFWAQGYSEPGAGSDLAALRTRARQDPETGDWLVTGQKTWTSLAHVSDWIFVLARAEEGSTGRDGLIFLMMPLDQPGIDIRPIRQINGGSEFNEVFFDGARASADDVLGAPGEGWKIAMALLGFERGISTLGQQMAFAQELQAITALARDSADPHAFAPALGRAWQGLRAMRHGAMRILEGLASGQNDAAALGYKYEWSNWHRSLGELAMQVLGAEGAVRSEDPEIARLQSLALFVRAETIYGGTNEIQLNIIAERGLGMPREPRGAA
ncbi:acyl-CoA dehydrogenase [Oceanibium sediminis]|uniref:acyl-CoA dehydrogenase n=1 Tax=Oceanibium sediminis TaxID=2026339 RepID=UPI0018E4DB93|nr:acyl-CoA dehydrogenase [Oceanibium sediminis]